jgi:prolipoprotein diacylglyceryltransferase
MTTQPLTQHPRIGFPRFFNIGGAWINSYRVFLIVGIYVGSLTAAALAQSLGHSPLRVGLSAMTCALFGLIGARIYHVLVYASYYLTRRARHRIWDVEGGGWSVFGALLTFVPAAVVVAWLIAVPLPDLIDYMGGGVLAGGVWIRLGCVFNGCCVGRQTRSRLGVRLHDIYERRKTRIPVQFLEIAWWLLGGVIFLTLWHRPAAPGSYALGVLAWYGFGRFFLEPLREAPDLIFGVVRINQIVAGALAAGALIALAMMA